MKSKYLFILLFLVFSCKPQDSNLLQINPKDWVENTFTLAEIADDISYIPLDDSIPISVIPPPRLQISNNSVFIPVGMGLRGSETGIIKISRDGKMTSKIGV